jgi:hypothetical protein
MIDSQDVWNNVTETAWHSVLMTDPGLILEQGIRLAGSAHKAKPA